MSVDWESEETQLLLNPRMAPEQQRAFSQVLHYGLKGHLWVSTSGSTQLKLAALSKRAFLHSAEAVNQFLQVQPGDHWLNPLPLFHVGGLAIMARAHLAGSAVTLYEKRWDPLDYHQQLATRGATLTSLVPTQVYDLVRLRLAAPKSLRAVLVGGGALAASLCAEATALGWPLYPTYAMTEACSSIAIAKGEGLFNILSHMQLSTDAEGRICIRSPSLLTLYADAEVNYFDPKVEGLLLTQDRGLVERGMLTLYGREGDFIKIGGESVHLTRLQGVLTECKLRIGSQVDCVLVAMPDERLGHTIHLAAVGEGSALVEAYNQRVMPFERIRQVHQVAEIPRSPLMKVLQDKLREKIHQREANPEASASPSCE